MYPQNPRSIWIHWFGLASSQISHETTDWDSWHTDWDHWQVWIYKIQVTYLDLQAMAFGKLPGCLWIPEYVDQAVVAKLHMDPLTDFLEVAKLHMDLKTET